MCWALIEGVVILLSISTFISLLSLIEYTGKTMRTKVYETAIVVVFLGALLAVFIFAGKK